MFEGGSLWQPPPMNPYTQGMPEELVKNDPQVIGERVAPVINQRESIEIVKSAASEPSHRKGQLSERYLHLTCILDILT